MTREQRRSARVRGSGGTVPWAAPQSRSEERWESYRSRSFVPRKGRGELYGQTQFYSYLGVDESGRTLEEKGSNKKIVMGSTNVSKDDGKSLVR